MTQLCEDPWDFIWTLRPRRKSIECLNLFWLKDFPIHVVCVAGSATPSGLPAGTISRSPTPISIRPPGPSSSPLLKSLQFLPASTRSWRSRKKKNRVFRLKMRKMQFLWVLPMPRTGFEPARCYSLPPQSSASANSATWAWGGDYTQESRLVENVGWVRVCQKIRAKERLERRHPRFR